MNFNIPTQFDCSGAPPLPDSVPAPLIAVVSQLSVAFCRTQTLTSSSTSLETATSLGGSATTTSASGSTSAMSPTRSMRSSVESLNGAAETAPAGVAARESLSLASSFPTSSSISSSSSRSIPFSTTIIIVSSLGAGVLALVILAAVLLCLRRRRRPLRLSPSLSTLDSYGDASERPVRRRSMPALLAWDSREKKSPTLSAPSLQHSPSSFSAVPISSPLPFYASFLAPSPSTPQSSPSCRTPSPPLNRRLYVVNSSRPTLLDVPSPPISALPTPTPTPSPSVMSVGTDPSIRRPTGKAVRLDEGLEEEKDGRRLEGETGSAYRWMLEEELEDDGYAVVSFDGHRLDRERSC